MHRHFLINLHFRFYTLAVCCSLVTVMALSQGAQSTDSTTVNIATRKVAVGKSIFTVQVATLSLAGWSPVVALGNDRIGGVEHLEQMAKRLGAVLAVNGTFFNPEDYAKSNHLPTEPYGTLIRNGSVIHIGNNGGVIAFTVDNHPLILPLRVSIEGGTAGSYLWPHNWYAYGFNHTPSGASANAVYIYTPERGAKVGFIYGAKVVVSSGRVTAIIHDKDVEIPRNGYVITLTGSERTQLLGRFSVGSSVEYRVKMLGPDKATLQAPAINMAIGAGPILVSNGQVVADHASQGFSGDKILTNRGRRTAIGVKPDGSLFITVGDNLYVKDMAAVMQALGANEALNLDGGASSGLWANGRYVVNPGRRLSNALLFLPTDN